MVLRNTLQLTLSHKLILTPSLQQAIKLLPMTTLELVDLLNQEVVENPLLEEVPAEEQPQTDAAAQVEQADPEPPPTTDRQDTWDDADYEYFFGEYLQEGYRPRIPQEIKELPPLENTLSTTRSLSDHLLWQLSLRTSDDLQRDIGAAIIGNLNEDGYLVASLDEIAAMGLWRAPEVDRALALVQALDPVGVAARDPQECLLLQIRHLGLAGTPSETIVQDAALLTLLETRQVPELARRLGMSVDALNHHLEIVRGLDPRPGSRLSPVAAHHVIPDVSVVKVDDQYVAVSHDDGMPRLRISPVYRRMLDKGSHASEETQAYVKDKCRSALWLIKSVDQRQKTIHKVATSIIQFQREFLDRGIEHLRPLVLRDVANDIGMHESTVSRVVNNKYMHTPQGVFEMKYFFHSGIHSSYGETVSSVTIKQRIRALIDTEDAQHPLSDARIVRRLHDDGLVLARRTIAKYRDDLRIPAASRRKAAV